ncbi:MAG TPA: SH3 domain-containing protein [Aliidongia sp.]|nr:SH3 domain-containing protein [Aliidongia sp.]
MLTSQAHGLMLAGSLALAVEGCASGGNMFSGGPDPSDSCGREHVAFAESKSFYLQEAAQGALLGALAGAALGAAGAAATGGNAGKGALIGGGVGLVAGGAAGYFNARAKENADRSALAGSISSDITKAAGEIDRTSTTFAAVRQCRFAASDRIKAAYKAGALSREQAATQLGDQKRRLDDEIALARQFGSKMAEQDQSFRFASDQLVKDDPQAQQYMAARQAQIASAGGEDYVATAAVNVRASPSAGGPKVGALYKGQHVQLSDEPAPGDWRKVALDDGTTGYVSMQYLTSAANAAAAPATPAPRPPVNTANRNVQVAVGATETIPEKRVAYDHAVDDAANQSNLAFNLDTSPTT